MQILVSVGITFITLAVTLPLFYIFIVSRVREKIEDEAVNKVKYELEGLVREFNKSALSNISLLENLTIRVKRILKEVESREQTPKKNKKKFKSGSSDALARDVSYAEESYMRKLNSMSYTVDEKTEKMLETDNSQNAIVNMYKLGMDTVLIARELNKSVSEVEMVLSLNLLKDGIDDSR